MGREHHESLVPHRVAKISQTASGFSSMTLEVGSCITFLRISSSAIAWQIPIPSAGAVARPSYNEGEEKYTLTSSGAETSCFYSLHQAERVTDRWPDLSDGPLAGTTSRSCRSNSPRIMEVVAISAANVESDFSIESMQPGVSGLSSPISDLRQRRFTIV